MKKQKGAKGTHENLVYLSEQMFRELEKSKRIDSDVTHKRRNKKQPPSLKG